MDGLSVAASVITVGSIAIQLIDTINQIHTFWKSIEDAPEDFQAIIKDLELLSSILQELNRSPKMRTSSIVKAALGVCKQKIERLLLVVQHYEPGFATHNKQKRRWNALKIIFKANEINKIHRSLEETKNTLLLALHISSISEIEKISSMIERNPSIQHHSGECVQSELNQQCPVNEQHRLRSELLTIHSSTVHLPVVRYLENKERHSSSSLSLLRRDDPNLVLKPQENSTYQRLGCTLRCGCTCHKAKHYETPYPLESFVGLLSVECPYYSIGHDRCNLRSCHRMTALALRVAYHFPRWLLAWRISLIAASQPLSGFQVMFKTARIRYHRDDIFYMAYDGNLEKVQACFDLGLASPHDITDTTYTSLLHFAMSNEHIEFARFLIRLGADPHCESKISMSPVAIAWEKILSNTSKSPASLLSLLEELDDGGYPAVQNMSSIHRAVLRLTTESLDDALEACSSNLDEGDADGRTPLSWAAFRGDFRCVRKLLVSGASANTPARDGCIPLHMAARAGSLPCLKILIRSTSRIDHKDSCGNTALHYTCKSESYAQNYLRCAECLLASGADINAEDLTGKTPLRVCIEASNLENTLLLLDRGARMDSYTRDGMTLIMAAVFYNRHGVLRLLIEKGAVRDIRLKLTTAALKAIAQSDAETRNILRMSLNPDIHQSLITYIQEQN